jgi:hypothetical protein
MYQDWWNVMRRGDVKTALAQMTESFDNAWKRESIMPLCASEALELGAGYLWLKDFESAQQHFDAFNERFPKFAHNPYDMAGVASWCLGKRQEAVTRWDEGLDVEFADSGYGIKPVLLLFFASVIDPNLHSMLVVKDLLRDRLRDPRTSRWPGPLAEFVLGRIDSASVRRSGVDSMHEDSTLLHVWQTDFWSAVIERSRGNESAYHSAMEKCGNLSWDDFDQCRDLFIHKLWSPEFYLARYEAGVAHQTC